MAANQSSVTTESNLTGLFKEAYAEELIDLSVKSNKLTKAVKFVSRKQETGNLYHQPVLLQQEAGFTYAAAGSGAFTLNSPVAMQTQDAQIQGSQIMLRSALDYEAAARADNDSKAFAEAGGFLIENMWSSMNKRLELAMLYGGTGLATVASYTNVDSTDTTLSITPGAWASGIWSGMEQSNFDVYNGSTKLNTNAFVVLTKVSVANKTLTVFGNSSDITAIQNAVSANPNTISIFFGGAYGQEQTGLQAILNNTGTLFNINASVYNLWAANQYPATGTLTVGQVLDAVGVAVGRGLEEDVVCYVNPQVWANLNTDLAGLRRWTSQEDDAKIGSKAITYIGQNGDVMVESHPFVKQGDCFIFPPNKMKRIGASEITFGSFGSSGDMFRELENNAGYELRVYSNQALLFETPAKGIYVSGFSVV